MAKKKTISQNDLDFLGVNEDNVIKSPFEDVIGERFGEYAKYIIQDRALPDLRDGLKPVQRRILFGMKESGMVATSDYKKSARIVGDVMGKYHPHGDSSIYEAMVRMSQWWKNSETFIDMHGNNGSMDDDPAAAMRYTEARLSPIAMEMLRDIDKDTVKMAYNFDDTLLEPTVLPARFPNLLVNGAKGISAGFATDIPPHNLGEVIDGVIARIKSPNCRLETILNIIPGPDFPTGGIVMGKQGIIDAYETGKGKIVIRSKCDVITNDENVRQIVISEIPYEVIKIQLVKRIDEIRFNKDIWGINEVRDESDRNGLKIVLDLDEQANSDLILNYLYKNTDLQVSYNFNIVTIDNRTPRLTGILDILDSYIKHQKDVILRRSTYDYNKCADRLHIDEGLIKAVSILDDVIATIRSSKNKADSKINLINKFGFTERQAEAIVTLQLYRLSSTDIVSLENEIAELKSSMEKLSLIINNDDELKKVIINELKEIKAKYARPRKSVLVDEIPDIVIDKLSTVIKEECMVAITRDGYGKRTNLKSYNLSQSKMPGCKQQDAIVSIVKATTLDTLLVFTSGGNYIYLPVFELTENKWKDEGNHINNISSYDGSEKIVSVICVNKFRSDLYVVLASSGGSIKRTCLSDFVVNRYSKSLSCMKLLNNETLTCAFVSNGKTDIAVLYASGQIVRYDENQVPVVGLKAGGVRAGSRSISEALVGGVGLYDDSKRNIMIATNKGGIKPIYPRYINSSSRNTVGMYAFKSFKSDHHDGVGITTYLDGDVIQIVTNFKTISIDVKDIAYQPIDRIINSSIKLEKLEKILTIINSYTLYVDDTIKAYKKINNEEKIASFDDSEAIKDEEKEKKEKYKNLSIDDLFKL
ncbi:MAG: DNA topoisomerase IV subunit A [Erysipelotrichaceae bacterium]|nr:DNA topoisomerase IV subunit A [Erysipelotrichaceae bacterium]